MDSTEEGVNEESALYARRHAHRKKFPGKGRHSNTVLVLRHSGEGSHATLHFLFAPTHTKRAN